MNKEEILKYTIDFHKTYEELSKKFKYITREETRQFDINSQNGKLMYATVEKVIGKILEENTKLKQAKQDLERQIKIKDKWCEMIVTVGFDCDGYTDSYNLQKLIDELVKYADNSVNSDDKQVIYFDDDKNKYNILMEKI